MAHPPRLVTAGLLACCYLFLFLSVPTASANKCTVGCHGMHSDASYKEGQTYTYALEGTSVTSVSEGQGEATLKLKADVELSVKPDCIRQIRLKNVQVNGANVAQQDLEKHALQFNYHHGHIDTELCAEPADSQASINIKRAVISLFQSSVAQEEGSTSRHEIDVLGGCVTDFNFAKEGDHQLVTKYRDLNHCSNRENIKQGLFSGITNQNAGLQSLPIINAHQKVEQRFKNGVLDKAVSTETYKLRPFSNGEAGAKTVVETVLTFKGQKGDSPTAPVSVPKSLIFEAPHVVVKSSVESIEKALQAIHKDDHEAVKSDEAKKFSELIRVLRTSSKKDILTVYHRIKAGAGFDKERDKKALLDALYRTGTGEAAEVVVELIKNKEITSLQSLMYYASLAFIQHVNLPSVTAISTLLDQPNLSRIGYLGIGQIIGRFCSQHACENVPEIKSAIEKISAKVKDGKANNRQDEDIIIAALKGLGNAKYMDESTQTKLANIATDKMVRNRIRVAAIEALPTKCAMKWKSTLAKSFTDQEEDSEIRIKIYLSYIACPCNKVVGIVKDTLDKERIYQVGSFIQSHLRNLRATADPYKQNAKAYFGQIRPRTKFPEDFRKFSANDEISYDINAFGFASTAESNVIFSQNSFVPRSASVNLTTEIFGHSFNFFELNARAENLDRMIEHFFGPKGVIPSQKPANVVRDGIVELTGLSKYIKERLEKSARGKREVKQADLDKFAKGVQLRTKEVDEDLDLDLSIKLFGVELAFLSFGGSDQKYTAQQIVDKIFDHFDQSVNKLKNLNYDIENHVHFLDAEFVYPTGLGIALNLGIAGSSVIRSKTHSKIDIPSILQDPKNAAIKIAVEPSASIEFVGDLKVTDGFGTESGMRVVTTLHTATGFDLNVKVLDGNGVDITLGVPKRKQEIIRVSSDVLYNNGKVDKYMPVKFSKGVEREACFEQFNAPLGLTICGHLSYPYENFAIMQKKPFYPLNGPAKFYVTIENNDVSSYHLKAFAKKGYENHDYAFEFLVETPNSRTNRYIKLAGQATLAPLPRAKIEFDSPIKKASAEAVINADAKEHSFSVTVKNDNTAYFTRIGVESVGGNKYKPVLEYKVPEQLQKLAGKAGDQSTEVKGTVEVADHDGGKKYVFNDVQLLANGHKILGLDGNAASTPKALDVDLNLSYADDKVGIKVDGKKLAPKHYTLTASIIPSKSPSASLGVDWELNIQKSTIDHKLSLTQGADLKSETDRLKLDQHAEFDSNVEKFILSAKNKLTYPRVGLVAELNGEVTKKTLKYDAELKYGKFKFGSELDAKINQNKPGDYAIDFEAEVLENKLEFDAKKTVLDEFKSKYENSLKMTPGGTYKADADIKWQVKKNDIDVRVDADLGFNNKKLKLDSGLIAKPDNIDNHVQLLANGVKYLDYNLKINRGSSHNGNLLFNLKSYLLANGQFSYQNGKGNGNLNIDIPKISRKIKGTGDITISGSTHAGNFELAYDAEKDPNKKIKISTVTDFTKSSIESKNIIEILTYKTEVDFKGKHAGSLMNGHQELEASVTLPNGRYVSLKGDRTVAKKDENIDVNAHFELADHKTKGNEIKKIIGNAKGTVFNLKNYLFDLSYDLKYVHSDGKHLSGKIVLKHTAQPNSDKKSATVDITGSGSLISTSHNAHVTVVYDPENISFKGLASRGNDLSIKSNIDIVHGNHVDKPHTIKGIVEAKLPSEKLKNIKFEIDETILDKKDDDGVFEYSKSKTLTYNDDKTIKLNVRYKHSGNMNFDDLGRFKRSYTANLKILDKPALTITEEYDHDLTGDTKKAHEKGSIKFGDKEVTGDVQAQWSPEFNKIGINGKFTTPIEKLKNIDLQLNHKHDDKSRKTDVTATVDGVKYTQSTEIILEGTPGIHLIFTCPAGTTELFAKFKTLGENEYSGEYKLSTPKGFVAVDGHVKLDSVDDFVLSVNFDSDKFKYRKMHVEVANMPNSQDGRRIFVTVTSEGKNLVTGSTNYKRHEEEKKVTLEGNGSLQIGENTRSSSFKYVRKQLTKETDKEVGVAIMLNASFGPSAIVGELKLSDKEVHVFNSYCEQSKDCANFKLHSTLDTDHVSHFNNNLQVEVNLKKFNVPVEFGIQASTKYSDFSFDHQANLYLHSSKDRTQYTYHVYSNKRESAAVLSLPSRELAIVAFHDLPANKHSGAYKIDISLYLDRKNKPTEKTSLIFAGNVNIDKNTVGIKGEAKFVYPTQPKDMIVKGDLSVKPGQEQLFDANFDIDLFANKNDKITATAKVTRHEVPKGQNVTAIFGLFSKGQKLDVKSDNHFAVSTNSLDYGSSFSYTDKNQKPKSMGAFLLVNPQQLDIDIYLPNIQLLKSHADIHVSKDLLKYEATSHFLGHVPTLLVIEVKDYNSFKLDFGRKGDNDKFAAHGKFVFGQLAELQADDFRNGKKNELLHVLIHLDENKFMKPDFGYNAKNIKELVDHVRHEIRERAAELGQIGKTVGNEVAVEFGDLFDHLKKAQPSLKSLVTYYHDELEKLKSELQADATVKEIQDIFNKTFGGIIAAITQTLEQFAGRFEDLNNQYNEIIHKLEDVAKTIYPSLVQSFESIAKAVISIVESYAKLVTVFAEAALKIINEHQKDIEELIGVVSDFAQDIAKIIFKGISQIEKEVKEFVQLLIQQIRALPVYEMAKNLYREALNYKLPPYIIQPVEEFLSNVKNILPTQELKDFFTTLYSYILKHVKHEKIDDANEVKKIYTQALNALRSVIALLQHHITVENMFGFIEAQIPVDASYLRRIPGLRTIRFSIVKLLVNRELPTLAELYYTYRPHHYAADTIPPAKKDAYFTDGGYVITFDSTQYIFGGSCNYILAQDVVDGNFTVVGEYANGNLVSVTVTEPGESITIKNSGHILVNNKPADYPATTKNLDAHITVPIRRINSKYGAKLVCTTGSSMACYLRVSGFYHAKLRGLLGDANNEPADDFIQPNGKVAAGTADFVNAYKLNPSCGAATVKSGEAPRSPVCTKYFTGKSSLNSCFNYVDPKSYRAACDQLVADGVKFGACAVAQTYVTNCFMQNIFINLPNDCVQCKVGDDNVNGGDSFSVKTPKKQADIIFVVEQEADNEKAFKTLVKPMINELRTELKQQGITDVFIGLVGFGEGMDYAMHYTSNNNINIEGGDVNNMKFTNAREPVITLQEAKEDKQGHKKVEFLRQRLAVELGTSKIANAFEDAIRYPFRAAASKAVIGLISSNCEKSAFSPISFQDYKMLLGRDITSKMGLTYYHVSPLADLEVSGKPAKTVVGYDADQVYTFADNKEKPLKGSSEMKSNLHLGHGDVCAKFAVSTGGAAFSSHNFLEAKPTQQSQFIKVAARKIAEDLTQVELEQDCVCAADTSYGYTAQVVSRPHCKVTARNDKRHKA